MTASFFLKVMRYSFIPWLGGFIAFLGGCLLYTALMSTLLTGLSFWAYVIPAVAIVVGIALIVGHLLAAYRTQTRIHTTPRSFKNTTTTINKRSIFKPQATPNTPSKPTIDKLIDQIQTTPIWGTTDYALYLCQKLKIPNPTSLNIKLCDQPEFNTYHEVTLSPSLSFTLLNTGWHWMTFLPKTKQAINNPGAGDCFFYALSLGFAMDIVTHQNQTLLQQWCQQDPKAAAILTLEQLQVLIDSPTEADALWQKLQLSLRRVLANNLKQDMQHSIANQKLIDNFLIRDYIEFIRNPDDCNEGNYFIDINYQLSDEERAYQSKANKLALLHLAAPPTIPDIELHLSTITNNGQQYNCLILYNQTYYYFDQQQQQLTQLAPTPQDIRLDRFFNGYQLFKTDLNPLDSESQTALTSLLTQPYAVICYQDMLFLAERHDIRQPYVCHPLVMQTRADEAFNEKLMRTEHFKRNIGLLKNAFNDLAVNTGRPAQKEEQEILSSIQECIFKTLPQSGALDASGEKEKKLIAAITGCNCAIDDTQAIKQLFIDRFFPKPTTPQSAQNSTEPRP